MKSDHAKGIIFGLLSALTFATYLSINRYVYVNYSVEPFHYTVTFFAAGGVFALLSMLIANRQEVPKLLTKDGAWVAANGVLTGLGLGVFVIGQKYTTAINASILVILTIFTTAIYSAFILKDRLRRTQIIWLIIMLVGTYLAVVGTQLLSLNKGDLIIACSALMLGLTNVLSKVLMKKNTSNFVSEVRLISAGILFALLGIILAGSSTVVTTAGLWPVVAGFFLWITIRLFYAAIHRLGPSQSIVITNVHPIITPIIGVFLLAEPYSVTKFAGSTIIILSVYFFAKKPKVSK